MALGIEIEFEEWIWWRCPECNKRNSVYFNWCNYWGHTLAGEEKFNVKNAKEVTTGSTKPKKELLNEVIMLLPFGNAVYRKCEQIIDRNPDEEDPKGIIRKALLEVAKIYDKKMSTGIEVNFESSLWSCPHCRATNPMYQDKCFHCGHRLAGQEKLIEKKQKEKNVGATYKRRIARNRSY